MKKYSKLMLASIALIVIGVLAAGHVAFWDRYQLEKDFKQVEMLMVYEDIQEIGAMSGLTPLETMQRLKKHGLTTVLFKEPTVKDLENAGQVTVFTGSEIKSLSYLGEPKPWLKQLIAEGDIQPQSTYLLFEDKEYYQQVAEQLAAKTDGVITHEYDGNIYLIETPLSYDTLAGIKDNKGIGLGFSADKFAEVEQAGLLAMVQVRTWPQVTAEGLEKVFAPLKNVSNLSAVFFNDTEIPGNPGLLPELARQIKETPTGATAMIEFFPQSGLTGLGMLLDKNVIRLHTISEEEMSERYSPANTAEAVDRLVLAAAERNVRALLIRPFESTVGQEPVQFYEAYLGDIKAGLESEGLKVGQADLLPPNPYSRLIMFLIGLGVIGGGLLLADKLGLGRWSILLGAAALLAWAGLLYLQPDAARKLMALLSVVIFPTLSVLTFVKKQGTSLAGATAKLVLMSLYSLVGALLMVGLLTDISYMLKLNQFSGVKLAHLVPLVIGAAYFAYLTASGEKLSERIADLAKRPVTIGLAIVAALLLAAVAVYILRTGNEGMSVSNLELQFRAWLDSTLGVRPRTKEFLLGHPAMLALLYFGYRDNRFLPLLVLGMIGQVSLVNTFAHIHTPLVVSIIRFANGLWLGVLIGIAVILGCKLLAKSARRYLENA